MALKSGCRGRKRCEPGTSVDDSRVHDRFDRDRAPVMLVLITVQANIPSAVFLRGQGYEPPERLISVVSGVGTTGSSLLGAVGLSLSLPATAARCRHFRNTVLVAMMAAPILFLFGAFAGYATLISDLLPGAVLIVVAGLALLGVLSDALKKVTAGPLIWGPLFSFAITLSELTLFGFGPFFCAIVGGIGVSLLIERPALRGLHASS